MRGKELGSLLLPTRHACMVATIVPPFRTVLMQLVLYGKWMLNLTPSQRIQMDGGPARIVGTFYSLTRLRVSARFIPPSPPFLHPMLCVVSPRHDKVQAMWDDFLETQALPQQQRRQQQEQEEEEEEGGAENTSPSSPLRASPSPPVAAAAASLNAFKAVLKARAGGSATTPAAAPASRGKLRGGPSPMNSNVLKRRLSVHVEQSVELQ